MYSIIYNVPTASGYLREHNVTCDENSLRETLDRVETVYGVARIEATDAINSMCIKCTHLGVDCHGTTCKTWTGCCSRETTERRRI